MTLALHDFITDAEAQRIIAEARREDLGPDQLDITSTLLVPADATGSAQIRARQGGILCGAALLPLIVAEYDPAIQLKLHLHDGDALTPDAVIAQVNGPLRSLLAMERIALNFLMHLSGIATLTARYVQTVRDTTAQIYDTRKTIPGLRALAKYAVTCGGGHAHRLGLYDAILVKDNHLAHLQPTDLANAVADMVRLARSTHPAPAFIEVEVDRLDQLEALLPVGCDIILLDNMPPDLLRQAVQMRDRIAPRIQLEASGGITLDNLHAIAQTGIERIAIGALTHSAPALDLGMDIVA